jgi:hypothetical protein
MSDSYVEIAEKENTGDKLCTVAYISLSVALIGAFAVAAKKRKEN